MLHAPAPSQADRNVDSSKPKSRQQDIEQNKDEKQDFIFFFFFLDQFIFRNTSHRLGPVCIYEPIQVKRQGNIEVPTQRVKEAETVRGAERR
jgi:hypothetical protein